MSYRASSLVDPRDSVAVRRCKGLRIDVLPVSKGALMTFGGPE